MKVFLSFLTAIILSLSSFSQNGLGRIQGVLTDSTTNEKLPFVHIILQQNKTTIKGTVTDFDGNYLLDSIQPGSYDISVSFVGYRNTKKSVKVFDNKLTEFNIKLEQGMDLEEVVIEYERPLVDADYTSSGRVRWNNSKMISPKYSEPSREQYNTIKDNQYQNVIKEPLSTFSIDVDRASYSNVRRFLNDGMLPPKDAIRIEEMINYFSYNYPEPQNEQPFSITTQLTECPWNEGNQLIHIGIQGKKIDTKETPPNNLVLLVDVSGSMDTQNKLGLLKSGLSLLVDQLREQDRIAIVAYAGAAGVVLESTSGTNKAKIKAQIENMTAGGSTAGGQGIKLAYSIAKQNFIKEGNNRVLLATDGDFNVGIRSQSGLISLIEQKRKDDIFLSVLGFGSGNLNDAMMEQVADKGNGNYNYIDNLNEAKKVLVNEFQSTLITIAKDVKSQIEFNPALVKSYRMIGYVNRQLEAEDFNNDLKDAGELGAGHSVTVLYEIVPIDKNGSSTPIVDDLKYQQENKKEDLKTSEFGDEIATIKFRYKAPTGNKSKLTTNVLLNKPLPLNETNENCRFSIAVAQFGMLLRESDYRGEMSFASTLSLAKSAKGKDEEGYRSEFIQLLELADLLKK